MDGSRRAAGFSLIEVMIAVSVLAVMMAGASSSIATVLRHNQIMREEGAAIQAAERMLAQVRAAATGVYGLAGVVTIYGETSGNPYTERARLLRGHTPKMGLKVSGTAQDELEVVLILDETPDESSYGRDLDGTSGPDGIDLNGDNDAVDILNSPASGSLFPLDLDGSETFGDAVAAGDLQLLPVVVIVRWRSLAGGLPGRVVLMTIIAD